jgi:hypothetical protein
MAHDESIARALAGEWGMPLLDAPLDHAAVVALLLTELKTPVVVACLSEISGPATEHSAEGPQAIEEGSAFAKALRAVDGPAARLMATAHSGAALAERGPLGKRWSALELEEHLRRTIETDPTKLGSLAFDLWLESGSCGSGVFAALGELVTGPGEVKAYAASNGVGYIVAGFPT